MKAVCTDSQFSLENMEQYIQGSQNLLKDSIHLNKTFAGCIEKQIFVIEIGLTKRKLINLVQRSHPSPGV